MTSFNNQFRSIKRLRITRQENIENKHQQIIEPYLTWRIMALDDNAILLCDFANIGNREESREMIIIEGPLMEMWMEHHHTV